MVVRRAQSTQKIEFIGRQVLLAHQWPSLATRRSIFYVDDIIVETPKPQIFFQKMINNCETRRKAGINKINMMKGTMDFLIIAF